MHDWIGIIFVLLAGGFAGIINTMAGGGSLLTLPALIFMGLPTDVANGTNRIAIVVQCLIASYNFNKNGYVDKKLVAYLSIPAVIGSVIGAAIAIKISDQLFNIVLAIIMVVMVVFIVWNPVKKNKLDEAIKYSKKRLSIGMIIFFFIGIYGGFIQAGVGFFVIAALTLLYGVTLVQANAIKLLVVGLYVLVSLGIFIYNGDIHWLYGVLLAVGNAAGAWIGSRLAIKRGDRIVKIVLVITVIIMAIKLSL